VSLDDAYKFSLIVSPFISAILVAVTGMYASRQKQATQWRNEMENYMRDVRKRTHDHESRFQGLPAVLAPFFADREAFEEHRGSVRESHQSLERRVGALEARR